MSEPHWDPGHMTICRSCTSHFWMTGFVSDRPAFEVCGVKELCRIQKRIMTHHQCWHWPLSEEETLTAPGD